jgi:predicted phage tail protein
MKNRTIWHYLLAVVAIVFGVLTIKEGSSVLFFDPVARANAGNYVPFVLWANTISGFLYLVVGIAILFGSRWAFRLSATIAVATALVFAALGVHILLGGLFEMRTVAAMTLRTAVWAAITFAILRIKNFSRSTL